MSDRIRELKLKINSELGLIDYFKKRNLPILRTRERLTRANRELCARQTLLLFEEGVKNER